MKLHLGSGTNYKEGWTNVDIDPEVKTDWCGDCNNMPFPDNTFDELLSHHSLEHFKCLFTIVDELARVCKDGAVWLIRVPMWSWGQNQGNPHHYLNFSPETFKFFDKKKGIYKRGQTQPYSLEGLETHHNEQQIVFKLKLHKDV